MSNDNDDATQLGSIRHHMNKAATARQSAGAPRIPSSKPANASTGAKRRR